MRRRELLPSRALPSGPVCVEYISEEQKNHYSSGMYSSDSNISYSYKKQLTSREKNSLET
jgi:hypothetical protein